MSSQFLPFRVYLLQFLKMIFNALVVKALPAPCFKIKQYGEVRFKNDADFRKNDHPHDYAISEAQNAYNADYTSENWVLMCENEVFWNDSPFNNEHLTGSDPVTVKLFCYFYEMLFTCEKSIDNIRIK